MSKIFNVCLINEDGSVEPLSNSEYPEKSEIPFKRPYRAVGVEWVFEINKKRLNFNKWITSVVVDPVSGLLLIGLGRNEPIYSIPDNAVVFNPDGNLHHRIIAPKMVEHNITNDRSFISEEVEFIEGVGLIYRTDVLQVSLAFGWEWIQHRRYDPMNQKWGEIISVSRR